MAEVSPDGGARTALNWSASATEVWFSESTSFYISLPFLCRKQKSANEDLAHSELQAKELKYSTCIKEKCIVFF